MRKTKILLLSAFIFLALCALALPAPQKQNYPTEEQKPPAHLIPCPDIKVLSFYAKLESTTLGDPLVEFPQDRILLSWILGNAGNVPLPKSSQMKIIIKWNGQRISGYSGTSEPTTPIEAPGSSVGWYDMAHTFPHGMKSTYSIQVLSAINECPKTNNQASFTIDEAELHRAKPKPRPSPIIKK
jgi:hypothetical protein